MTVQAEAPGAAKGLLRLVAALMLAAAVALGWAPLALADEPTASTMVVNGKLEADGTLRITQTLTFGDAAPDEVTQRFATRENELDDTYRVFEISDVNVTVGGQDANAKVSTEGHFTVVTVPGVQLAGQKMVTTYTVKGAARNAGDLTVVAWRVLQGLSVGVDASSGTIDSPGVTSSIDCLAGPPNTTQKCSLFGSGTHDHPQPYFEDAARGPGETITLALTFPKLQVAPNEVIKHDWTLDRAFSFSPLALLLSLALLALGGLAIYALHRRVGTDVADGQAATAVATFTPVGDGESVFTLTDGLRPGHIGTVADERVDPIDVTATLLDLAIRGYVRIHELPATSAHRGLDWRFERLNRPDADLHPYERQLLDAVCPPDGREVTVSTLPQAVRPIVGDVQNALYDEVVTQGWFERRPDDTRSSWTRLGWAALIIAMIVTGVLVAFTTLGLVGIAAIIVALGIMWVADKMPRRTAVGTRLLNGLGAMSSLLQTHPTDQMPKGREYEELSKLLPYAIVLGGRERWLDAIVAADDDPDIADADDLHWYHAPNDWHLADLPDSIGAFVTSVQGQLFSR